MVCHHSPIDLKETVRPSYPPKHSQKPDFKGFSFIVRLIKMYLFEKIQRDSNPVQIVESKINIFGVVNIMRSKKTLG
jgi:hypothetical protein